MPIEVSVVIKVKEYFFENNTIREEISHPHEIKG